MSRIGRSPVTVGSGVQVNVTPANEVVVKGAKWTQKVALRPEISAKFENGQVVLTRKDESQSSRALHGLYRALVQNAVTGVSTGFTKSLDLVGVVTAQLFRAKRSNSRSATHTRSSSRFLKASK